MQFVTCIEVTKITLIRIRSGADHIIFETKLPAATWPFEGTAHFTLDAARGTGEEYCKKHFPNVPFEFRTDQE